MDRNSADITDSDYLDDESLSSSTAPTTADAQDDPQSPLADEEATETAREGEDRLVFSPGELNQAGEDKEYFHPDKQHRFGAPKDANDHALTPDVEVTPDNDIKRI